MSVRNLFNSDRLSLILICIGLGAMRDCHCSTEADEFLFPYDLPGGEEIAFSTTDDTIQRYDFKVPFTFFNKTYESVFISDNGQVSFEGGGVTRFTALCTPSSIPMIMAFWTDIDRMDDTTTAKILHRETTNRTLLQQASRAVFKAFPELHGISLSWMFIVTWVEVPFFGTRRCTLPLDSSPRNTFQITLTSDGTHSFALLYYKKITWTTGTASGGSCAGLGGSPAKAGFDYGDSVTLYTIPGSCENSIINVTQTSNINEPGKWVFRIDSNLKTASCEDFADVQDKKLKLKPKIIPFMASVPLELQGPCLKEAKYTCTFHDLNRNGPIKITTVGLPTADFKKIVCKIPHINRAGRVQVDLHVTPVADFNINSGTSPELEEKLYSGNLYVVNSDLGGDSLRLNFVRSKDSGEKILVDAQWNPNFFQREVELDIFHKRRRRSTYVPQQSLEIIVETFDGLEWTENGILEKNIPNSGGYQGTLPEDAKRRLDQILSKITPELISISLRRSEKEGEINWSKLGADVMASMKNLFDTFNPNSWGREYCANWTRHVDPPPNDISPCPPTRELAEVDINFEKDGAGIMMKYFHPGGEYSVRQKVPSNSKAGSQCVYDSSGLLMIGPPGGGTLDRYSPNYNKVLHWQHDVLPYIACCRFSGDHSDENCKNAYYRFRPSDDGTNYPRPRVTRATGDPHMRTFDGLSYTFNGVGEFWMVLMEAPFSSFKMQARMEQYENSDGVAMNASVFTAASMEESTLQEGNVTVQVAFVNGRFIVTLDGESLDFDDDTMPGLSMNYKSTSLTFHGNHKISVSFSSGFSFEFSTVPHERIMNIVGMSTTTCATSGLLGNNDGDPDNDLQAPDGTLLHGENATAYAIHHSFGMKWIVSESSSTFQYSPGKSYADYKKLDFEPKFLNPKDLEGVTPEVREICEGNIECLFDYVTTGSAALSEETKEVTEMVNKTLETISKPVLMCPSLKPPEHGFLQVTNMMIGGKITYLCEEGFQLQNAQHCTCLPSQEWSCTPSGQPKCVDQSSFKMECDAPPALENGDIIGLNYTMGESVRLQCSDGWDIFWRDCRFNGRNGLCDENCNVTYTCATYTDLDGSQRMEWQGYAGEIERIRCLSRFAGNVADFLKKQKVILYAATKRELDDTVKEKPYLLGC